MATTSGYLQGGQVVNNTPNKIGIALASGEFPVKITNASGTLYASNGLGDKKIYVQLCESDGSNAYTMATLDGSSLVMVLGSNSPTYSASPVRCYNLAGKTIYLRIVGINYIQQNYTSGTSITIETSTRQSYTLSLSNGTGISATSGGGSVSEATSRSISATVSSGYTFSTWTSNAGGTISSPTSASTTFLMPSNNVTLTASATVNYYTLTVSKGTGGSSVSGGGSVAFGSSNSISATAASGYKFKNWTSNNGGTFANANSASTTFTMPAGAVTVTANFELNQFSLTTTVSPSGTGTVTQGGTITVGGTKSLTASPSTGYSFSSWSKTSGTLSSTTSNPTTFTMGTSNATVTANFTINSYTLTTAVSPSGGGSVTSGGSLNYNATKSLTATASTGYTFSSWSKTAGTLSSTTANPTTFTMGTSAATVTANFTHNQYTLTLSKSPSAGGTVTGGGTKYYNDSVTIKANAATGYTFKNWTTSSGGTIASATSATTTYTMPNGNATVTANFTHNTYTLSKSSSPSAGGTITLGKTSCYYGDVVSISATAATGYTFSGWTTTSGTIASASSASTTITMSTSNATVTATFTQNSYSVSKAVSPTGTGSFNVNKSSAHYQDTITMSSISPNTGYQFSSWSTSPAVTVSNNSFSMPNGNITVTANFAKTAYAVTSASNPTAGGSVTLSKTSANYGDTITIGATVATGYTFSSWSTDPSVTITNNSFTMPAQAVAVTANFTHNTYTLTGACDPVAGGSMTLSKATAYYDDSITISAEPAIGYQFDKWVTNPSVTITNNTFKMPNSNITVTAKFVKVDYSVTCVSDPTGAGTITATPSTAQMGDIVTLSQTPRIEYAFDGYSSSPSVTISDSQFTMPASNVIITGSYNLTPSEASLNASSYTGGDTAVLTITSAQTSFTHKYRLVFGDYIDTGWVNVAAGVTSVNIYIPVEWVLLLHGDTSVSGGSLTLQTYSGAVFVGEDTVGSLTYNALGSSVITLTARRSDPWGNPYRYGKFATYEITKPAAITNYSLIYDGDTVSNPATTGLVLPGSRRILTELSTEISMQLTYGTETFTVVGSIPGFEKITKNISIN